MPSETSSWPRIVNCYDDIPKVFRDYVNTQKYFPYIVYSPPDNWGLKIYTNAKLTCLYQDRIMILENNNGSVQQDCYYFKDIDYVEQGRILLYSWIKVSGFSEGAFSTTMVIYNTVMIELFTMVVKSIRKSQFLNVNEAMTLDLSSLDFLQSLSYKFLNYTRESILLGEKIKQTVYQPLLRKKYLFFFKKTIIWGHIIILTDQELIVLKNEENDKSNNKEQETFGGIWMHIPLAKIAQINIDAQAGKDLIILSIKLRQEIVILKFIRSKQQELAALIADFSETL
ncbi:MAG: hypothetical protein LLG02_03690 [Pelosinus sp.]|nr:hypothetical protein [Pelosinus sp.]